MWRNSLFTKKAVASWIMQEMGAGVGIVRVLDWKSESLLIQDYSPLALWCLRAWIWWWLAVTADETQDYLSQVMGKRSEGSEWWANQNGIKEPQANYFLWEEHNLNDIPFTKAIRNVLVRGYQVHWDKIHRLCWPGMWEVTRRKNPLWFHFWQLDGITPSNQKHKRRHVWE